jgi:hypothetical protein
MNPTITPELSVISDDAAYVTVRISLSVIVITTNSFVLYISNGARELEQSSVARVEACKFLRNANFNSASDRSALLGAYYTDDIPRVFLSLMLAAM